MTEPTIPELVARLRGKLHRMGPFGEAQFSCSDIAALLDALERHPSGDSGGVGEALADPFTLGKILRVAQFVADEPWEVTGADEDTHVFACEIRDLLVNETTEADTVDTAPKGAGGEKRMRLRLSIDHGARLWDAINRYVVSCRGNPDKHVYGNTPRMTAVAEVEKVVSEALESLTTWRPIEECGELDEGEIYLVSWRGHDPHEARVWTWTDGIWEDEEGYEQQPPDYIHSVGPIRGPGKG